MTTEERIHPHDRPRRSPLTDPRALLSSATFHALVWIGAVGLAAIGATLPRSTTPRPKVLHAELGPVDNRVPAEAGGGAPGELGGDRMAPTVELRPEDAPRPEATREAIADALLADALPGQLPEAPAPGALPGPTTTGLGLFLGPGSGGGGGEGGGAGGGIGRGLGPATEFFGARERAGSFAYAIDCSGSMYEFNALEIAKRELLASLEQLPPDARFGVIFYNRDVTVLSDSDGQPGLMPTTSANKDRTRTRLATIQPDGGTNTLGALQAALDRKPEVIFLLTDGQALTYDHVDSLVASAGPTRIHTIEFGGGPPLGDDSPLQLLADRTGGTYRRIDVRQLARPAR